MFLTEEQSRKLCQEFATKAKVSCKEMANFLKVPQWRVKAFFKYHTIKMWIKKHANVKGLVNLLAILCFGWILGQYISDKHIYHITSSARNLTQTAVDLQNICDRDSDMCELTHKAMQSLMKRI